MDTSYLKTIWGAVYSKTSAITTLFKQKPEPDRDPELHPFWTYVSENEDPDGQAAVKLLEGRLEVLLDWDRLGISAKTTPIVLAARLGRLSVVRALIAEGAIVDPYHQRHQSKSILIMAVLNSSRSNAAVFEAFVTAGANISVSDMKSKSILMATVIKGAVPETEILLQHGASVSDMDEDLRTPLLCCRFHQPSVYVRLVQLLLDTGADIEATDHRNWTSLSHAALLDCSLTVALLLAEGADVLATNDDGDTALQVATSHHASTDALSRAEGCAKGI